ncbi:MAG: 5-amino-6-(D-ribitylamino)uracil--L-tyrosine 4-hydroxyphenyl transferase CofH [Actinobacteria bacterium]|uniref:FO synthase n=1 Tax=freshwater metagenome TaxID=449393 RepID=A0A6J7M4F0_9ZZZZ|nr:5-amino-6-(D-ribitylamino)uracil--L-tyrosine 4-hydroxyphenyl transferase CofH [Actinomycetota bacterium]MSW04609.1 5-amino-6-(D-ribitylamino)uracil--L-tyrosine 4-hydroxyphenyl transferase CofH [Actinomycetota bacterium]
MALNREHLDLINAPLSDLLGEASRLRDYGHGHRMTFSPKVFIPLTMLCRDRCGYCTFAKPPAHLENPYLGLDEVISIASKGRQSGCFEALFTLGEEPEERYPAARDWLTANGYSSTIDYLVAAAGAVLSETGMLPHANPGAISEAELLRLRAVSPSQGMMIETLAARLGEAGGPHFGAPDKTPERRLATLEAAGRARVPFTTGILVGIGETREERLEALLAISDSHARHGHVQEVIVQNFLPKPGTSMHRSDPCDYDEYLRTVATARIVLGSAMHLQAPPNLSDPEQLSALIGAGIDDWGGVSPVTPDHVNPERPWPALNALRDATEAAGKSLAPRLTVYPEYALSDDWIHPDVRTAVRRASDSEGLARDDEWSAGSNETPPVLLVSSEIRASGAVAEVIAGVAAGERVGFDEIVTLLEARGQNAQAVYRLADALRREIIGDVVTFVRNRNINYTNICTFKCRFCAFSKGPLSLNLRGKPYMLGVEEIQRRVIEGVECGATEVCLQGGIHPDFDGDYYLDLARAVKEVAPSIHIHGFTALEVTEGAKRLGMPLKDYLILAKEAGLATLPGTAAEVLDDEVRAIICSDKVNTEEWLEAHRIAHSVGLRSNVTILFGTVENPRHVANHMLRTRALQDETGGFTEFVPLPFVHMASPIHLQGKSRLGPTFREVLLMHAVGRIAYRGSIDNIQVSWVKCGTVGASQILQAGANDLGGTLMDESISRAAGAAHGQEVDEFELRNIVEGIGRPLEQRTTLYGRVTTVGRRLRPVDDDGLLASHADHTTPSENATALMPENGTQGVPVQLSSRSLTGDRK